MRQMVIHELWHIVLTDLTAPFEHESAPFHAQMSYSEERTVSWISRAPIWREVCKL